MARTSFRPESRIGEKINDWEITGFHYTCKKLVYECRCKCGHEESLVYNSIKHSKPKCYFCDFVEKNNELIGKKFGKVVIKAFIRTEKRYQFITECSVCGNENIMQKWQIIQNGGCAKCRHGFYAGKELDGLLLLERVEKSKFKIKCHCGKIFERVPKKYKGKYIDCGCSKIDKELEGATAKIGKKYQFLKITKVLGRFRGHYLLELKCKCGNIVICENGHEFKSKSCGCIPTGTRGEQKANAKFSNIEIKALRELYALGTYSVDELADMYGISTNYLSRIVKGHIWKSV